jgi:hypothetical protein
MGVLFNGRSSSILGASFLRCNNYELIFAKMNRAVFMAIFSQTHLVTLITTTTTTTTALFI